MYSVVNSVRDIQSAGSKLSPYGQPVAPRPGTTGNLVDKSTIIWKDFLHAVKKRQGMIHRLREAALDSSTPLPMLRKMLLDIRQTTLSLIEDALEIEYRARMSSSKSTHRAFKFGRLPPITSFKAMEEKEDIYAMVDIIDDVNDLFSIPNIKVMLPVVFPNRRNPFLLGKTIDELAVAQPPHPEPGNVDEEVKVLELLRYKRASRALLRAEAQVLNRLPIDLYELELLLERMRDDLNLEKVFRSVCVLLDNDSNHTNNYQQDEANLNCLQSPVFNIEAHDFLMRLNQFQGAQPMRIDVQVAVRQYLRECTLDYLDDPITRFLLEWMELVLNATQELSKTGVSAEFRITASASTTASGLPGLPSGSAKGRRMSRPPTMERIAEAGMGQEEFPSPPRTASPPNALAVEVQADDFEKTHEQITVVDAERKKRLTTFSPRRLDGRPGTSIPAARPHHQQVTQPPPSSSMQTKEVGTDMIIQDSNAAVDVSPLRRPLKRKALPPAPAPVESMEFDPSAAPPAIIRRKIKVEVEKAIRELGLLRAADEEGFPAQETLSSLRYEVQKMQNELLRRHVLDPRHYEVSSLDAHMLARHGLTVPGVNAFDPFSRPKKPSARTAGSTPLLVAQRTIPLVGYRHRIGSATIGGGGGGGEEGEVYSAMVSLQMDVDQRCLWGEISVTLGYALTYHLLDDQRVKPLPASANMQEQILLQRSRVSQLMYSQITSNTLDDLIAAKAKQRESMVAPVMDELVKLAQNTGMSSSLTRVEGQSDAEQEVLLPFNRVLLNSKFTEDQVLVDLTISRNDRCDGLVVYVTPIAGLFGARGSGAAGGAGPVVIDLHDRELEVLLINQNALFKQAMVKWSSLQIIAQWLASQIKIRKVPALSLGGTTSRLAKTLKPLDENVSVTSQITLTPRRNEMESQEVGGEVATGTVNLNTLLLLEVELNRQIALSPQLIEHWKSRNLPKIVGLECGLVARQDLEMLRLEINLTLPSKKAYLRLLANSVENDNLDMVNLDEFSDDEDPYDNGVEEDAQRQEAQGEAASQKITLSFQWTRAELLAFGHAPLINSKAVAITTSKDREQVESHPESLLWNVLNRLAVHFKGSVSHPYKSSVDSWELVFERQLAREVRTLSQQVLLLTVQAFGGEVAVFPQPVQAKNHSKEDASAERIVSRRLTEQEVEEIVLSEGWPVKLLAYEERKNLSTALLDKLKVITDNGRQRLELVSYVETRMITVIRLAQADQEEAELGSVEINNQQTLSDLRILIKHEMDPDELPQQFRFLYKGVVCSLRQESFRRAWDCLPTCFLLPKALQSHEIAIETDDILQKRLLNPHLAKKNDAGPAVMRKMVKGQRRVPGRYHPVPLPTLCSIYEGKGEIYLLHDAQNLLLPGDIIRIGNVLGRDYLVSAVGRRVDEDRIDYTVVFIDPEYDLLTEPDFHMPIQGRTPWPAKTAGIYYHPETGAPMQLLHPAKDKIQQQQPEQQAKQGQGKVENVYTYPEEFGLQINKTIQWAKKAAALDPSAPLLSTAANVAGDGQSLKDGVGGSATAGAGGDDVSRHTATTASSASQATKKSARPPLLRAFEDVWIWKCIPAKEDTRPKWRQLYDDGLVHYSYSLTNSDEFFVFFRVRAYYSYLEVLCTDQRLACPHSQRVQEMRNIPFEFYLRTIFDRLTEWLPVYRKGVDRNKLVKLLKEVQAFPDLKRPARIAQIDALFQKLVKTDMGIVQKYLSFVGFVQWVKDVSLLRFPPKKKSNKKDGDDEDGQQQSVASSNPQQSKRKATINSNAPSSKEKEDDDNSSLMTDDLSSVGDEGGPGLGGNTSAGSSLKRAMSRTISSLGRNPSSTSLTRGTMLRKNSTLNSNKRALKNVPEEESATPWIDPEHMQFALQKFVLDYLMLYPHWYEVPWQEAKVMAMKKEALPYCAATRLAAILRGWLARGKYLNFLKQHIKLQANIRRKLSARRTAAVRSLLYEDWAYRMRYYYVTRINAWIRRFLKRCWYLHVMEQIKRQQIIIVKARRQRLKKLRQAEKKAVIYAEAVRLSGVMVFITVMRKDPRNYTKDYGINIEVYAPISQTTFHFTLEDSELRSYMALELEVEVVTVGEMMDIRNLKRLMAARLIVHQSKGLHAKSPPTVILSKHALGQRGEKALTRAIRIQGHFFVCKVFETVDDVAVQCYHTVSSKVFTCKMPMKEMRAWITEEYQVNCKEEMEKFSDPPILKPKNRKLFHVWIVQHLAIDTRHGQFKVLFACHLLKSKKKEMIIKIQSVWRRALVRPVIVRMLDAVMLKVYSVPGDPDSSYYLNRYTGASAWEKPKLLGPCDLPTIPTSHWETIYYYDEQGIPHEHYVNPFTGKYTHLLPDAAARILQALARNYLLKTISMPLKDFIKAGHMYRSAEPKYHQTNGGGGLKLSAVVNYALAEHVVDLEEESAKELYRQAVELSEANPLVTRSYAFFLIGTCPAPVGINRERAMVLLKDAERRDPGAPTFQLAYFLFQFACLRKPYDVRTLLNLAIVQCYLYPDRLSYVAEKLLRRALALAPFDERVMEIWKLLRDRFPERQILYSSLMRRAGLPLDPNSEKRKIIHGREVVESRAWAGWCFVEDDRLGASKRFALAKHPYWYNPATGEERDTNPDFKEEWAIRRARSILQESTGEYGLQSFYDPLTADYFEYFALTDSYQ